MVKLSDLPLDVQLEIATHKLAGHTIDIRSAAGDQIDQGYWVKQLELWLTGIAHNSLEIVSLQFAPNGDLEEAVYWLNPERR